mgnify:CR=1 FL=1
MRTTRWMLLGATMVAAGCGGVVVRTPPADDAAVSDTPATDTPATDTPATDTPATDAPTTDAPRVCRSSADCNPGEECYIREGCDVPSLCGPGLGRPCTDDLAPFCGCDGTTFYGSSSCPPRVYAHRGACASVDGGPPPVCTFPDGRTCPVGATCPDSDGCNTCTCSPGGTLACTERACVDAGPPACALPYGGTCPVGATCAVDRCTACTCLAGGGLMCASRCTDAGTTTDAAVPIACRSGADCPSSMMCDGPAGCGVPWSCVPARPCTADVAPFCGCDGTTFSGSSSCPGRPYRSRGACM